MAERKQKKNDKKNTGATIGYEAQLWQMADALRGDEAIAHARRGNTGRRVLPGGGFPGIDHVYAQILEVPDVTRCKRGSSGKRDACDLRVAHVHGPTGSLARRRQSRGFGCSGTVEIQDAMLQILLEELVKRQLEQLPSPPLGQQRKSKTGFEQRDGGYPDRFGRLAIEPSYDRCLGRSAHERR